MADQAATAAAAMMIGKRMAGVPQGWRMSKEIFFAVGVLAGAAMGGSQSASRSLMASLTPTEREAEFLGFYDGFCGKASAVIGTFLFGALSLATGSQRAAVVSVGLFFVAGLWLLRTVEDPFWARTRR
jgi:UMF1 family MFS transporter